jgi:MoaA/NifB/PqqE/SkfB family radical SAM enzyme
MNVTREPRPAEHQSASVDMPKKTRFANAYRTIYEGLNYRLRTFAGGCFASFCRPVSIGFMLTSLCNARCVHCDIWKNKGKPDSPTAEQWKKVLTDLRAWLGSVGVYFSGGEALLVPFAPDLVAHASNIGLFVEFLTHGYWDDQSRIERLAMANPGRITISLDGLGEAHSKIRGREKFFEKTTTSIRTLQRLRQENRLRFTIRLKHVIMAQNLGQAAEVARFANQDGMEVFFQPVEQNYNTPEDPRWFEHTDNWPTDTERAVGIVRELIQLKRNGLPIANSYEQLEVMIPYFRDPAAMRVSTTQHTAHERKAVCTALTNLELWPNGDVLPCYGMPAVGNVKERSIREIWENRPQWWNGGCCLERRCGEREKELLSITASAP